MSAVLVTEAVPDVSRDLSLQDRNQQIQSLAQRFTAKEIARAFVIKTQEMKAYGEANGIVFASSDRRSAADMRRAREEIREMHMETQARLLPPIKPSPGPDGIKLSPLLELRSRRAFWEGSNRVLINLMEIAKTHTQAEAVRKTGMSRRRLCTLSYEYDIVFKDKVLPFDETAANQDIIKRAEQPYQLDGVRGVALARLNHFIMGSI
jgi:hypothetical protein